MLYLGQTAALATQHGKERAIAPALAAPLGLVLRVPRGIDTDSLGTFTGEVERTGSLRDVLRRKAEMGMAASGLPLGIASEGSFGPHPLIPFLAAGREAMIFVDAERGLEVVEEASSVDTNFAALDVSPAADLDGFLARAGFPGHAVILRSEGAITKGIQSRADLDRLLAAATGPVRLETDMRAHVNPTRMGEITRLAARLARRILTPCPACAAPGFGPLRSLPGLPCAACGTPTALTRAVVAGCLACGEESLTPRPDGRTAATPADCPECNP